MTAQGFHQNSARSVWVPLSVVPQPQYGNGTVWQDAGLRIATFQGSVIAADRDAPPGLQVRFGPSEQWLNLGPGEVLWAPREYKEVHVRIWRMGAGAPANSTYLSIQMRAGNAGSVALSPAFVDRDGFLGSSGFNLYNAPIQAHDGPRSGNPGGLFFQAAELATNNRQILLGNWFSQADLNRARFLVVEMDVVLGEMTAAPLRVVEPSAVDANFTPYWTVNIRDPLDSGQNAYRFGGGHNRVVLDPALGVDSAGELRGRLAFSGPFASWQALELSALQSGTDLTAAQTGSTRRCRVSLADERPRCFASAKGGLYPLFPAGGVAGTAGWSVLLQNSGFNAAGNHKVCDFGICASAVTGAPTRTFLSDPVFASLTTRRRDFTSAALAAQSYFGTLENRFGGGCVFVACSAGQDFTLQYVRPHVMVYEP